MTTTGSGSGSESGSGHRSRYLIGIDLGTTNSAAAYVDTKGRARPSADIRIFEAPQLVAPGETAPRSILPSFLYIPGGPELPPGAAALPWRADAKRIAGEFARTQGARVPSRLVSSAKSWLCHPKVDRDAAILPWGSPAEVEKISPVEASAEYLRHLRDAWNWEIAKSDESQRFERQEIVLTVPASFDESARELTVEAARRAGLERLTLLEEPQAAFYCWIVSHQEGWQSQVRAGERILVCDVGGGTTDFSLLSVVETEAGPGFRRVAVGDHLLLGGDNIDLALAHRVEGRLGGARLDAEQWSALRSACRTAKEKLLADDPAEEWPVTIPGRGSRVIGGSLGTRIGRSEALEWILEGYFPACGRDAEPDREGRGGFREFGLPFVADPAITKHLAWFLRRHGEEAGAGGPVRPDAILFNGGALTPSLLRDRIRDAVAGWHPGSEPPRVLSNASLDLAVAIGAAYYGFVPRGVWFLLVGGTARSFYVGFAAGDSGLSGEGGNSWLCVAPRDAREGESFTIEGRDFDLTTGRPVMFPLASSSVRAGDKAGDLVAFDPETMLELPPLASEMRTGRKARSDKARVRLGARVTEVGTIEIACQSATDDRAWTLSIQHRLGTRARTSVDGGEANRVVLESGVLEAAGEAIRATFGGAASGSGEGAGPETLIKRLEGILEIQRAEWPISALRALWEPLRDVAEGRGASPRHEARWLNLTGYCLRPGRGYPLDETRVRWVWPLFHQGLRHGRDVSVWTEWWVLWRRLAAGLNRQHHDEIFRKAGPLAVPPKGGAHPAKKMGRNKPEGNELSELWRLLASLERLTPSQKEGLGEALAREIAGPEGGRHGVWCLGRLGTRAPVYSPINTVVEPGRAARWIGAILGRTPKSDRERNDAAFAVASLARMTGDRARDVDEATRALALDRLRAWDAPAEATRMVEEIVETEGAEQGRQLGDALPIGLRLVEAGEGD